MMMMMMMMMVTTVHSARYYSKYSLRGAMPKM